MRNSRRLLRTMAAALLAALTANVALGTTAAQATVQGLDGAYYQFDSAPGSIANSLSMISAAGGPTATFIANTICFPSCGDTVSDADTLADLLNGNASNVSNGAVTPLDDHAVVLTGSIYLTAGDVLSLGSDDGSALWINGVELIDNDGDHGFGYASQVYTGPTGWQQIGILQFEDAGVTGLALLDNDVAVGGDAISTGVPEPSTWALLILGFAGLGYVSYRASGKMARGSGSAARVRVA